MDIHKNARTTRHSRMLMVQRLASGWTPAAVAQAQGVTARTVRKMARPLCRGRRGRAGRSLLPAASQPTRLGGPAEQEIEGLRRQRMTGPAIARRLGRPLSTVGKVLRRRGLGRLRALEPRPAIVRYERERPGELLHLDTKKLGRIGGAAAHNGPAHCPRAGRRLSPSRGLGWECLHIAINDCSRKLTYAELLPEDASAASAVALPRTRSRVVCRARHRRPRRHDRQRLLLQVQRRFPALMAALGLQQLPHAAHTPRTNGKAERFIQPALREWAYAKPYPSSADRAAAMLPWITSYNHCRPHSALGGKTPISRLTRDDVLGKRQRERVAPAAVSGSRPEEQITLWKSYEMRRPASQTGHLR